MSTNPRNTNPRNTNSRSTPQELICELFLLGLTLAILWYAGSIFTDSLLHPHLVILSVVVHAGWSVLRRLRLPLLVAGILNALAAMSLYSYLRYSDSAHRFADDAELDGNLWQNYATDWQTMTTALRDEIVPLTLSTGFLLVALMIVFLLSGLADWAAFRIRMSSADGLLGYSFAFLAVMLFGVGANRVLAAFLAASLGLGFALSHRVFANRKRSPVGRPALLGTGVVVVVLVLGAGFVGGTNLAPGGDPTRINLASLQSISTGSDTQRVVLNPLVGIQSRLQTRNNTKLFTVISPRPQYWRVTALDEFDGQSWSSSYSYNSASGTLDPAQSPISGDDTVRLDQRYSLGDFDTDWLPAAFDVRRVANRGSQDFEILYDGDSSTLLVNVEGGGKSVGGLTYDVSSDIPNYTAAQLSQVSFGDYLTYPELTQQYLALPDEVSQQAFDAALEVAGDAQVPYDIALALQNWFRREFTYNLNVEEGHSIDRVEDFLEVKQGYCEQFASTYAMMARMLGLPTRVVVGFTWGESDVLTGDLAQDFPGLDLDSSQRAFSVYGRHYHSWPEVFIPGYGWVLMEPTPTRAPPDSSHSGLAPEQEDSEPAEDEPAEEALIPENILTPADPVASPETTDVAPQDSRGNFWLLAVAVLLAIVLVLGVFPARGALYLRRIRNSAGEHVLLSWRRAQLIWRRAGLARTADMTLHEFVHKVEGQSSRSNDALRRLADLTAEMAYGRRAASGSAYASGAPPASGTPPASHPEALIAEALRLQTTRQALMRIPRWKRLLGFGVTSPLFLGGRPKGP